MSLCMGCMREIGDNTLCPSCGFDNSKEQTAPFLPYGTLLQGRYITGSVMETNGESTRYMAFDKQTGDVVILCEFLPVGLFRRDSGLELVVRFDDDEDYRKLKSDFISYYRTIAELKDFSALTKIQNIFQENNTAYIIEEHLDLIPFEEYVQRSNGHLEWDVARPLFMPVISALEAMHRRGIGHYAISPKNMRITSYGKIKIVGFATSNERKRGTPLKSQLFSGCAAPEQYMDNFPIDNITEIYGFSATLFYALTGNLPSNAKERLKDSRLLMSTNTVKRLPPHVVTAVANGLHVKRENRITDFDDLRSQLSVSHTAQAIQEEISKTANMNLKKNDVKSKEMSGKTVAIIAASVTVVILAIIGIFALNSDFNPFGSSSSATEESTAASTEDWTGATVPDYVGVYYDNACIKAEESGVSLDREVEEVYSDKYAEGVIVEQSPAAGSALKDVGEYTISVKVSKGVQMRELPVVENYDAESVISNLTSEGFVVYSEETNSNYVDEGKVIGYSGSYQAGDTLEEGSSVTIIISLGPQETTASTTTEQ